MTRFRLLSLALLACLLAGGLAAEQARSFHPFNGTLPDQGSDRLALEKPHMLDNALAYSMSVQQARQQRDFSAVQALALSALGLILGLAWWQDRHWARQQRAAPPPALGAPTRLKILQGLHGPPSHEQWQRSYQANREVFSVRWDGRKG
jgi:hypothetical protein